MQNKGIYSNSISLLYLFKQSRGKSDYNQPLYDCCERSRG